MSVCARKMAVSALRLSPECFFHKFWIIFHANGRNYFHRLTGILVSALMIIEEAIIRVYNKTLKSVLLGRRIAASGHCR